MYKKKMRCLIQLVVAPARKQSCKILLVERGFIDPKNAVGSGIIIFNQHTMNILVSIVGRIINHEVKIKSIVLMSVILEIVSGERKMQ